jgi:hypothetical protein
MLLHFVNLDYKLLNYLWDIRLLYIFKKQKTMKHIKFKILLSSFLLIGVIIDAQTTYHKMLGSNTTDWYIFQDHIPVKPAGSSNATSMYLSAGKFTAMIDTVILSKKYKKMYHVYDTPGLNINQHLGYMREDTITKKVYMLNLGATTEDLLYDFSLTLGSTTILNFPDISGSFPNATYTVTTIDTVLTRIGYRKQFKLKSATSDTLIYIESIGSIMHPLYIYNSYYNMGLFSFGGSSSCQYPYDLGLACKFSNDEKYFHSCTYNLALMNPCIFKYDSCNYYTSCSGIKELNNVITCNISPNPATEKTNLEIDLTTEELVSIDLYDVSGRKLKTLFKGKLIPNKNTISMDLSDFQTGYYFVKVNGENISINQSVIISR